MKIFKRILLNSLIILGLSNISLAQQNVKKNYTQPDFQGNIMVRDTAGVSDLLKLYYYLNTNTDTVLTKYRNEVRMFLISKLRVQHADSSTYANVSGQLGYSGSCADAYIDSIYACSPIVIHADIQGDGNMTVSGNKPSDTRIYVTDSADMGIRINTTGTFGLINNGVNDYGITVSGTNDESAIKIESNNNQGIYIAGSSVNYQLRVDNSGSNATAKIQGRALIDSLEVYNKLDVTGSPGNLTVSNNTSSKNISASNNLTVGDSVILHSRISTTGDTVLMRENNITKYKLLSKTRIDTALYSYNSDKLDGKQDTAFLSSAGDNGYGNYVIHGDITATNDIYATDTINSGSVIKAVTGTITGNETVGGTFGVTGKSTHGDIATFNDTILIKDATGADTCRIYDSGTGTYFTGDNSFYYNKPINLLNGQSVNFYGLTNTNYGSVFAEDATGSAVLKLQTNTGKGLIQFVDDALFMQKIKMSNKDTITWANPSGNYNARLFNDTNYFTYTGSIGFLVSGQPLLSNYRIGVNRLSPLSLLDVGANTVNNNAFNFVNTDINKIPTTIAQATDTSSINANFSTTGSPTFNVKGKTGNSIMTVDSLGITCSHLIGRSDSSDYSYNSLKLNNKLDTAFLSSTGDIGYGSYTLTTQLTTPKIIGGNDNTSSLIFQTTTDTGDTGSDFIFNGGNNGATELARLKYDSTNNVGLFGIGLNAPAYTLHTLSSGAKTSAFVGTYIDNQATTATPAINKTGLYVDCSTGSWAGNAVIGITSKVASGAFIGTRYSFNASGGCFYNSQADATAYTPAIANNFGSYGRGLAMRNTNLTNNVFTQIHFLGPKGQGAGIAAIFPTGSSEIYPTYVNSDLDFYVNESVGATAFSILYLKGGTTNKVGILTNSPTHTLSFNGAAARTLGLEPAAAAAAGNSFTLNSGNSGAGNNLDAGDFITQTGAGTGTMTDGGSDFSVQTTTGGATGGTATTVYSPAEKMRVLSRQLINNDTNTVAKAGSYYDLTASKSGFGFIQIGDNQEFAWFCFTTAGVVTLVTNSANVTTTVKTEASLCIVDNGSNVRISNELNATLTMTLGVFYNQ